MSQQLLIIDSRDRENTQTGQKTLKMVFDNPITFSKIELLAVDFPISATTDDEESLYYIQIREFPIVAQGVNQNDRSAFIIMRNSDIGNRTMQFANTTFIQFIDFGRPITFSELNISIRHRKKATEILRIGSDYTLIFAIS